MATNRVVIAGSPIAAAQMSEFYQQVGRGGLTAPHMDALLEKRDPFLPNIDWYCVFRGYLDFPPGETLRLGDYGGCADIADEWCIPVLKGLTLKRLLATLDRVGVSVEVDAHLNEEKLIHVRDPNVSGSYGIRFKRRVKADLGLANDLSSQLIEANPTGITVIEGLLLELGYWITVHGHLNAHDHTLCTGTKDITPAESDQRNPHGVWGLSWFIPKLSLSYHHEPSKYSLRHRSRKPCGEWPIAA